MPSKQSLQLSDLRRKFGGKNESKIYNKHFKSVSEGVISNSGTRQAPWSGIPTLLDADIRTLDNLKGLDVALLGIPMDLGISNRNGCRFGPRALRAIERIGPYNHALHIAPKTKLKVVDVGDVPFRGRYDLNQCLQDIEQTVLKILQAGAIPLSVGGDHSITLAILRALGKQKPIAMVHIDAHCDTGGPYDNCRFHHGGPFRHAVLEGLLNPKQTIQIGIRGSSEYLWEFSYDSGMTVIHAEDIERHGIYSVITKTRDLIEDNPVYISFDIDSLDPAYAPGTGTPEIGGITPREAQVLLRGLSGMNIVGGDVVEVSPAYDATTNTAQVGAQMLFEILSIIAMKN